MNDTPEIRNKLSLEGKTLSMSNASPQKSRRTTLLTILTTLLLAGFGAIIGFLAGPYLKPIFSGTGAGGDVLFIIIIPLLLYIVLAVHECGHLLGGRIMGSRFTIFIVGPLKIMREQRGIRIGLNKNLTAAGGLAGSMPRAESNLSRTMLVTVVGGPAASLLLSIISAILGFWPSLLPAPLAYIFAIITISSSAIFLATLIPTHTGGYFTDGARIIMLLKGGPQSERWCAAIVFQGAILAGKLPREWSTALIQKVVALPDGTLDDIVGNSIAYYHALDTGNIADAQAFLEYQLTNINRVPSLIQSGIKLEAAYFEARYHHNVAVARTWQEQARGGLVDRSTRLRVEAAILLAEGKNDEARTRIQEGLLSVKDAMYAGTGRMEEAWLKNMQMKMGEYPK